MGFADSLEVLDGERLSLTTKATVQSTGRLNFTPETASMMGITADCTVVLFKANDRDLGAIVKPGEDWRGFKVKKTGPYFYIQLRNYLEERGIDYKGSTRIVFDITQVEEKLEGLPLFKMMRRDITHAPKVLEAPESVKKALSGASAEEVGEDSASKEETPTAQENA